jgi:hypothetical protein
MAKHRGAGVRRLYTGMFKSAHDERGNRRRALELGDVPGLGVVRHWWLVRRLRHALLKKHAQQSIQRFRIASANPLLPTAKAQESIHNLTVQNPDIHLFLLQPPAETGDYNNLLCDRIRSIALFGYTRRIRRRGVRSKALGAVVQSYLRR